MNMPPMSDAPPSVVVVGAGPAGVRAAQTPVSYTHLTLPTKA